MAQAVLYGDEVLVLIRSVVASRATSDRPSFSAIRWDCLWVMIAYALALVAQSFITVSYRYAVEKSEDAYEQLKSILYWSIIGTMFNIFSMAFGRLSVIALLLTLQGTTISLGWRRALQILGVLQLIISALQALVTILQCNPPRKAWDIAAPGSCPLAEETKQIGYASGAFGAFSDFALAIYPIVLIIGPQQQMKRSLKVAICVIMSGGVVAGVAGIATSALVKDVTYTGGYGTVLTWTLTQTWFIIIFGSLPTIRPVFVAFGETLRMLSARLKSRLVSHEATDRSSWIELEDQKQPGAQHRPDAWLDTHTTQTTINSSTERQDSVMR
ncbi:hypothetical protein CLAFUW4_03579 [Fulvia fulva]|uniref:Rhodopsin domain-containing protein n=1 Tax=Passalora fulva TaxID=5499 RepID=A0A9Q8LBA5_PASFU|nr:uncharacterized protein CLAFUR5_03559 [Fulvia fulva]KAK4631179.1 hypothetical protein CLAFUR4_03568 [Fulvia fulva]KAK4632821.1 hypothetical protein CLAFUR0_03573 [Fulvia fulva]UJO14094.1 hypothetical protein CLAFUR5_03559 [Fulvia fulva]WPV10989.1 hypothetical protein CLAFUW4_03579 [Fulvia fulva]WPV26857.1 hypothetical protein CLAFUW7_03571 [Fulvia fulva]